MNIPARFLFLFLLFLPKICCAQLYLAKVVLNNKWGAINPEGYLVIPARYDDIGEWGNGLIQVNIGAKEDRYGVSGGKWGYCNAAGVLKIPLKFDDAATFHEGLAAVQLNGKWGFIDTLGNVVIPFSYEDVSFFSEGLCAVGKGGYWGFINSRGKTIIPVQFAGVSEFEEGIAVAIEKPYSGKHCLIDTSGKRLTRSVYEEIGSFNNGLARVEVADTVAPYAIRTGYINRKGEEVIPAVYVAADDFSNGYAAAGIVTPYQDEPGNPVYKMGYINTRGEWVIPAQYSFAGPFVDGVAVVETETRPIDTRRNVLLRNDTTPGSILIDTTGRILPVGTWRHLFRADKNLYTARQSPLRNGVITLQGDTLIYLNHGLLSYLGNGCFVSWNMGDYIVDTSGAILFRSDRYSMDNQRKFRFGMLAVWDKETRKWGCIDSSGKTMIPFKYDSIGEFEQVYLYAQQLQPARVRKP